MRSFLTAAFLVALSPLVSAQTFASIHVGAAGFDLSGTGEAVVADVRVSHLVGPYLAIEGGLGVSPVSEQFRDTVYLLPSLEAQVGPTIRDAARVYAGVGVGSFIPFLGDGPPRRVVNYDPQPEFAFVGSLGVDAGLTPSVLVRVAGRLRATVGDGPDVFGGTFTEVTGGIGVRL